MIENERKKKEEKCWKKFLNNDRGNANFEGKETYLKKVPFEKRNARKKD